MDGSFHHVDAGKRVEKCLLGREEIPLPELLIEQGSVFREILSQETWQKELTEEQKQHLQTFLPTFSKDNEREKQETLRRMFAGENFKFGNPLKQFQTKLRDGFFAPDIAKYARLCRKGKEREYKIGQQRYYSALLEEILLSRQLMLEEVRHLPPGEHPKFVYNPPPPKEPVREGKLTTKYIKILKEVREECQVEDTSSEEDLPPEKVPPPRSKKGAAKSLYPVPSPEHSPTHVVSTFALRPQTNGELTPHTPATLEAPAKVKVHTISPMEITEEDYFEMLRKHKRRRLENLDSPDMDTQNIMLQDIMFRCQAMKKPPTKPPVSPSLGTGGKRRVKGRERPERRVRKEKVSKEAIHVKAEEDSGSTCGRNGVKVEGEVKTEGPSTVHRDEDEDGSVTDFPLQESLPPRLLCDQYSNFFSILRDLINDFNESKATTPKIEEKVREWQESPTSPLNPWFSQQTNWVDSVFSALKFLSGDALGLDLENFIPFLDYKERAQQWKWIGAGRDDDDSLLPLFRHWLENKEDNSSDIFDSSQGSPPQPRIKTSYVVKPSTQDEKDFFKEQESRRFDNPHKSFTYSMHGYESVVGPVKGVYSKESAMNKAREHALLIPDRPPYVTILTLVRDAAARLPNGEGTRGDICELLKDSGFTAPDVTDAQVNTVVSGALDRLHYEKDPCVKYEVNRKVWIYLHRNRTEEEFEKIHQAQGAAVKAKKSLQKPKATKSRSKDVSGGTTIPAIPASAPPSTVPAAATPRPTSAQSSTASDTINVETVNSAPSTPTQTPTPTPTPTPLHSPKGPTSSPRASHASPKQATVNAKVPLASPVRATINILQAAQQAAVHSPVMESHLRGSPRLLTPQPSTPGGKPVTISFMPSRPEGSPVPVMTHVRPGTPGNHAGKPVSFSILQSQELAHKLAVSSGGIAGQSPTPGTLLITNTGKSEVLVQSQKTLSTVPTSTLASNPALVTITKAVMSSTMPTSVHTKTIPGSHASPLAAATPMVARLIQQVPTQMMSVGNLLQGSLQKFTGKQSGPTTIKIQGGNYVQPVGGGKPIHLTGKPLSTAKGLVQIAGKVGQHQIGLVQTPHGAVSTLNIISPDAARGTHAITTVTSCSAKESMSGTILSSALQGGIMSHSKASPNVLQSQGVQVVSQPKVVTPSQTGIVVTQLAPGGLTLRPGLQALSQAKMINQGVLPAQFIVQQAHDGVNTTVTQGGNMGTPIIVSTPGGKPGQSIQLVKTMLSQHGGLKPGQATILISQPGLPNAVSTTITPGNHLIQTSAKAARSSPKGKHQPVYARIITPPPGMRLTNVTAPGQSIPGGPGGVSVIQTVGKLPSGTVVTTTGQPGVTMVTRAADGATSQGSKEPSK